MEAPPQPPSAAGDPLQPQGFRIMCSYGGHIIPRPHDKILSYIGGDTRIVLIDRHVSVSDLRARLAKTLSLDDTFMLKYQLPGEDLDSLISVANDEDLQNMIEEHDRLRKGRLRLFLFPKTFENFDLGMVCGNKGFSDEWFMGVLNGKVKSLSAAFSDSLNCLIGMEIDGGDCNGGDYASKEGPLMVDEKKLACDGGIVNQDARSVPESPIIPANSPPFGSLSSSKSVKIGGLGIEEQLQQISVLGNPSDHNNVVDQTQQNSKNAVSGDSVNRFITSDDGQSDHNGWQAMEKVQTQQLQQKQSSINGLFELTSPHSISSEGSITNPMSRQRQAIHQEPPTLTGQYDQLHHALLHHPQQFIHPSSTQFVPSGPIPVASYYHPIYTSQHQNNPNHQPTQPHQVYFIQARPSQAYHLPQNYGELALNAPSNQPHRDPNMAYSRALNANYAQIHRLPQSMEDNKAAYAQMYYAAMAQPSAPAPHDSSRQNLMENVKQP